MEILEYQSSYWTIHYNSSENAVVCRIISGEHIGEAFFKSQMQEYAKAVVKHKAAKLLLNTQNGSYSMSPDIQTWVEQEIAPQTIGAGQNKIAVVLSNDIFSAVATEQLMDEGIIQEIVTKYFDDEESAKKWLYL